MADTQDTTGEQSYNIEALVGMQVKTSRFMKKKEEVDLVQNGHYDELGSIGKKLGYVQRGSPLTSTTSTSSSSTTTTSTSSSTSTTSTSSSTSTS
jgi:hypothetical protein